MITMPVARLIFQGGNRVVGGGSIYRLIKKSLPSEKMQGGNDKV